MLSSIQRAFLLAVTVLAITAMAVPEKAIAEMVGAQGRQKDSIFRRFSQTEKSSPGRMVMFEVPVAIRPQTDPNATIGENLGFNYVISFMPQNRVYGSVGFNMARMEWTPSDPRVRSADVKQFDITQNVNFWVRRVLIINLGFGVGVMDSIVVLEDRHFEHNVVPYIPVQFGAAIPLGGTFILGMRFAITPFFGDGQVMGTTRLLAGVGFGF